MAHEASDPEVGENKVMVRGRIRQVSLCFSVFTLVILLRIAYLATFSGDQREALKKQSRYSETVLIPGCRGSIYAPDGSVIAHSVRRLDIVWQVPQNYNVAESSWHDLSEESVLTLPPFEQLEYLPGMSVTVAHDLDIGDQEIWDMVFANPQLKPRVFFKRETTKEPKWRNIVGTTAIDPKTGIEIGVSGLEQLYDETLRPRMRYCRFLHGKERLIGDKERADGLNVVLQEEIPYGGGRHNGVE